jgi:hypothetical protein
MNFCAQVLVNAVTGKVRISTDGYQWRRLTSAVPDSLISDMTSSPVALLCCLTIPVLILFAYVYWAKMTRRTLPHWRNALGLVAMLVVSSEWLFHTLGWVFYSLGIQMRALDTLKTVLDFGIYFTPVGMVASVFLRGFPRLLIIAAWLLMAVFAGHFYVV